MHLLLIGISHKTAPVELRERLDFQVRGTSPADPRVQAMSLQDPKILVALVSWVIYSFEAFAARRIGWGGRRTAYLSALGFVLVLLNFVPISYFLTRSHDF